MTYNHGLESCDSPSYSHYHRGCRCEACKLDHKIWREYRKQGESYCHHEWTDTKEVKEHVHFLLEHGFTRYKIAKLAGVSPYWLYAMENRDSMKVHKDKAEKVLALRLEDIKEEDWDKVDATKLAASLRAIIRLGCTIDELSRVSHLSRQTISGLYNRHGKKIMAYRKTERELSKAIKKLAPEYVRRKDGKA